MINCRILIEDVWFPTSKDDQHSRTKFGKLKWNKFTIIVTKFLFKTWVILFEKVFIVILTRHYYSITKKKTCIRISKRVFCSTPSLLTRINAVRRVSSHPPEKSAPHASRCNAFSRSHNPRSTEIKHRKNSLQRSFSVTKSFGADA